MFFCRFGHTKNLCRSKPRCAKCGDNHTTEECSIEDIHYRCLFCSGNHLATNKSCPENTRQRNIKIEMAEKSISYLEASKSFPPVKKSYAEITSSFTSPTQPSTFSTFQFPPQTTSYRKTVFKRPSQKAPLQRGYDQKAHKSILQEFIGPQSPNGCAFLNNLPSDNKQVSLPHETVKALIESIVKIFIDSSLIPSNVASKINISSIIYNALLSEDPTVELQECSS